MGQFKEKTPEEIQQEKEQAQMEEEAAKAITVGSRCKVTVKNAPPRRGVVMFVGEVSPPPPCLVTMYTVHRKKQQQILQ